ncbi:MAG: dehypoxanthine futalosine cyclase [Planctomycetes bacterium]|nr:dehypoxanthine futalosine cyclase [Planctomycetota bacterium]
MIDVTNDKRLNEISDKVLSGKRITSTEGLWLLENAPDHALAVLAHHVKTVKHPEPYVSYVISRNINYTNVCITDCDFCSFYRRPLDPEAYSLTLEQMREKAQETLDLGGTEILLQGGHNPKLPLKYYQDMLGQFRAMGLHNHSFSPSEIQNFALFWGMTVPQVLKELIAAGLNSIPGGGAEVLSDRVRNIICPKKGGAQDWLMPMREAHKLGIRSSATMMMGHVETVAERIEHIEHLRNLQDETGGFTAFIVWTFQSFGNRMSNIKMSGAREYLRMLAVSRIYLDNFDNFQSSWVTQGGQVGQLSLRYGCNDMGSLMIEENVVRLAGASFRMNELMIRDLVREAGFTPRRRNFFYQLQDEPAGLDQKLRAESIASDPGRVPVSA